MRTTRDLFGAPPPPKPAPAATPAKPLRLTGANGAFVCAACGADAHFGFGRKLGEPGSG